MNIRIIQPVRLLSAVMLMFVPVGEAFSGEFRPLDMPDQKSRSATQSQQGPRAAEQNFDSVYRQFKTDMSGKTPAERDSLRKIFQAKRDEAIRQQQWEEVKYYSGLLDILGK